MDNFSKLDYDTAKFKNLLNVICDVCGKHFQQEKRTIYNSRKNNNTFTSCSKKCLFKLTKQNMGYQEPIETKCSNCGGLFTKHAYAFKKSNNHFCNQSCAATYNNTHKTKGYRRSKLEKWLEEQLTLLYPDLEIWYSDKTTINSELDIYIPSFNLAFELNGIFHYEPIFGESKLEQIQNNDYRKFQACLEKGIELCIIDTSSQKYVKPSTSQKYLDIITKLVNMKLSKTDRVEVL